jgi:hypothetical protein
VVLVDVHPDDWRRGYAEVESAAQHHMAMRQHEMAMRHQLERERAAEEAARTIRDHLLLLRR